MAEQAAERKAAEREVSGDIGEHLRVAGTPSKRERRRHRLLSTVRTGLSAFCPFLCPHPPPTPCRHTFLRTRPRADRATLPAD